MERKFTLLIIISIIATPLFAQVATRNNSGWLEILDDELIYDNNNHAAFTCLEEWEGNLIIAFREGEAHDASSSNKGVIKVLRDINQVWAPQHVFIREGVDLRDPYILKWGDRLLLYTHMFYSEMKDNKWADLKPIAHNAPYAPKLPSIWKKRVYNNVAYGIGFRHGEWPLLFKSEDGINWEVVCEYKLGGNATEADMVFIGEKMYICIRVDTPDGSNSFWGTSVYPFTECQWSVMGIGVASPEMIAHSSKTILLACREYDYHRKDGTDKRYLSLFALDTKGRVKERCIIVDDLGTQGDQGYASFSKGKKGEYRMSYYAGDRNNTVVKLLSFKINENRIRRAK